MRVLPALLPLLATLLATPGLSESSDATATAQRSMHLQTMRNSLDFFLRMTDARLRAEQDSAREPPREFLKLESRLGKGLEQLGQGINGFISGRPGAAAPAFLVVPQASLDDALMKLIETGRKILEVAFEPLQMEYQSLNHSDALSEVTGYVKDVEVKKLSMFEVDKLESNLERLTLRLNVSFDKLDAFGKYDLDATASGQLHVFGNGSFRVRAYELKLFLGLGLGYENEHFYVRNLTVYVSMSKLSVFMENMLGGGQVGETVCKILGDVGPAYLDEFNEEISTFLSEQYTDVINALLAGFSLDDIIDWISGAKPPPIIGRSKT